MCYNKIRSASLWGILLLFSCYAVPSEYDEVEYCESNAKSQKDPTTCSATIVKDDSITMVSRVQGDLNNLMLSRIVKRDDIYVLSIKREDEIFLGVSNELYDTYIEYVDVLNSHKTTE